MTIGCGAEVGRTMFLSWLLLLLRPVGSSLSLSCNLASKMELVSVFLLLTSSRRLESVDKQCAFQKGSTKIVETKEGCKASNITHL